MQYRNFGRLDWQASALGFGCMRLPTTDGQPWGPNVAEPQAISMVRHAIDAGLNYVDTAYPYHQGQSERVVGLALRGGYRDRVKLATKLPLWHVTGPDDFDRLLGEQLDRLQTDHVDCYLLHALNRQHWATVRQHDLLARAEAALADGRIRHLGFSFHDEYALFEEIVTAYDWTFCQIQYNYMDTDHQAGERGLKLAAGLGLAVVIMEPLLGGRLANPPAEVRAAMAPAPGGRAPAEWALDWLWDQPEVSVVLSGMSTMAQVAANLAAAERSAVSSFGAGEHAVITAARECYRARTAVNCTNCRYCLPCPAGVDIPANFRFLNDGHLYDDWDGVRTMYPLFVPADQRADQCVACNDCADKCPQQIPISDWMPKVAAQLAKPAA